jgi:hypothetical protein
VVACLPPHSRFACTNLAKDDGFLGAIKLRSTTSFRGEVKPSVPCRKIVGILKILTSMKEIIRRKISPAISSPSFSA